MMMCSLLWMAVRLGSGRITRARHMEKETRTWPTCGVQSACCASRILRLQSLRPQGPLASHIRLGVKTAVEVERCLGLYTGKLDPRRLDISSRHQRASNRAGVPLDSHRHVPSCSNQAAGEAAPADSNLSFGSKMTMSR